MKFYALIVFNVVALSVCFDAQAALSGRLPATPGGTDYQAYYDDQLGITWAADIHANGSGTIAHHQSWVDNLVIDGVTGWRLADMDVNGDGTIVNCNAADAATCADNEYGFMYYFNNVSIGNPSPFIGLNGGSFFSQTPFLSPGSGFHHGFEFTFGGNFALGDNNMYWAWAVHDGDVAAVVPIPAGVWLFATAMLGLIGFQRRESES